LRSDGAPRRGPERLFRRPALRRILTGGAEDSDAPPPVPSGTYLGAAPADSPAADRRGGAELIKADGGVVFHQNIFPRQDFI